MSQEPEPNQTPHPLVALTPNDLYAMLRRATRNTLILGLIAAAGLWIGAGWQSAALLAIGTLISAASIIEWRRLAQLACDRMDRKKTPTSAALVVAFSVLKLTVFAGVIYVSLKCFRGSVVALLSGLALAAATILWEALKLLRE
jgi:uncharacterized membrane protein